MKFEISKSKIDMDKALSEIDKLKTDITKEQIDKVILIASKKRECLSISKDLYLGVSKFTKELDKSKPKIEILWEELDSKVFNDLIPAINEVTTIANYFYRIQIDREDFIEEILLPKVKTLISYIKLFNSEKVLNLANQSETAVFREDILPIIRFNENTKDCDLKAHLDKLIQDLLGYVA